MWVSPVGTASGQWPKWHLLRWLLEDCLPSIDWVDHLQKTGPWVCWHVRASLMNALAQLKGRQPGPIAEKEACKKLLRQPVSDVTVRESRGRSGPQSPARADPGECWIPPHHQIWAAGFSVARPSQRGCLCKRPLGQGLLSLFLPLGDFWQSRGGYFWGHSYPFDDSKYPLPFCCICIVPFSRVMY